MRCSIGSGPIPADGSSKEQGRSRSPRRRRRSGGSLLADPLRVDRRRSGPGPGRHHKKRDWSASGAAIRRHTIFGLELERAAVRQLGLHCGLTRQTFQIRPRFQSLTKCCVITIMELSMIPDRKCDDRGCLSRRRHRQAAAADCPCIGREGLALLRSARHHRKDDHRQNQIFRFQSGDTQQDRGGIGFGHRHNPGNRRDPACLGVSVQMSGPALRDHLVIAQH